VVPPRNVDPERSYGMGLSVHGAAVEGVGQARAHIQREWTYMIAPTNRRPFGFDWESFGRYDALEALADAKAVFGHDPTRVHVMGHSMGGHGTWQLGTLYPTLFATLGPSAGWNSFWSYTGGNPPSGVFGAAQASSLTSNYSANLSQRGVFILHGDADDNVPVREARSMRMLLEGNTEAFGYHEEPGKGHWWSIDGYEKAACVNWNDKFAMMEQRRLDPTELDFAFVTPSPWASPRHSYATIRSRTSPLQDATLTSVSDGSVVTLMTTNVRSMDIDGAALLNKGVTELIVDGNPQRLEATVLTMGPGEGKRAGIRGPFNEVMQRPFCYVIDTAAEGRYPNLAAYLTSSWAVIGNGQACTIDIADVGPWVSETHNLIYLGISPAQIPWDTDLDISVDAGSLTFAGTPFGDAAIMMVHPAHDRLAGFLYASDGLENLLFDITPFSSRQILPDYVILSAEGLLNAGFFDGDWRYDAALDAVP